MLKINLKLGLIFIIINVLQCFSQAAILPNVNLSYHNNESDSLDFKPNGLLLLRGVKENSSSFLHEAMIFKTILSAIRASNPLQSRNTLNDLNQKMYGDGVEHKFPPFMERVIQRIQTYFSIYKYTDAAASNSNQQSTPVRGDNANTTTTTTNGSLNFDDYNEIDVNLTSINIVNNNNNKNKTKTTIKPLTVKPIKTSTRRTTLPTVTTTTTAATTVMAHNIENTTADEENEFIEIKKNL